MASALIINLKYNYVYSIFKIGLIIPDFFRLVIRTVNIRVHLDYSENLF